MMGFQFDRLLTTGGLIAPTVNTTAASTYATTYLNYVDYSYLQQQQLAAQQAAGSQYPIQQAAPMPVIEDEVGWLRRRVSEVCWS